MRDFKDFVQSGFADIQTDYHYLLAHKGKAACQISGIETLAFTGGGGGKEDHFLAFSQHILQIRTDRTEDFFHQAVAVFLHHNGMSFRIGLRNISDYGDIGNLFDISPAFDLETEQVAKVNNSNWQP